MLSHKVKKKGRKEEGGEIESSIILLEFYLGTPLICSLY